MEKIQFLQYNDIEEQTLMQPHSVSPRGRGSERKREKYKNQTHSLLFFTFAIVSVGTCIAGSRSDLK